MKKSLPIALFLLPLSAFAQSFGPGGEGVAVGSSTIITNLQYSDTFTIGTDPSNGTRNGDPYSVGSFPLSNQEAKVENTYGNPARSWNTNAFSLNNDANVYQTDNSPYPGGSGAGSASGITQTGAGTDSQPIPYESDFGIQYGLGTNFVVQVDGVMPTDRFDINIGNTNGSVFSSDGLSIFFRGVGADSQIGVFNGSVGETNTGFATTAVLNKWNNYAVAFNLSAKTLSIYTNEVLEGTVDLNTFDNGAYANKLDADSTDYISIGGHTSPTDTNQIGIIWTDNFQVGTIPEPGTWAMVAGGFALLGAVLRFRRNARQV